MLIPVTTWKNPKGIILNEWSQTQKSTYGMPSISCKNSSKSKSRKEKTGHLFFWLFLVLGKVSIAEEHSITFENYLYFNWNDNYTIYVKIHKTVQLKQQHFILCKWNSIWSSLERRIRREFWSGFEPLIPVAGHQLPGTDATGAASPKVGKNNPKMDSAAVRGKAWPEVRRHVRGAAPLGGCPQEAARVQSYCLPSHPAFSV